MTTSDLEARLIRLSELRFLVTDEADRKKLIEAADVVHALTIRSENIRQALAEIAEGERFHP